MNRLILAILLLSVISSFAQVQLGAGSYNPNAAGPPQHEGPLVTSNFDKPIITQDWWTSLLWSKWQNPAGFSNVMHPHPFSMRCQSSGLGIGYSRDASIYNGNAGTSFDNIYNHNYNEDLNVGLLGVNFNDTKAEDYSDWDVLANWTNGSDVLRARMGHGFTYVYFTREGNKDVFVSAQGNVSIQNNVLIIDRSGKHYAVFAPAGSIWVQNGNGYSNSLNGKDYWSVALLPDGSPEALQLWNQYAFSFVSSTHTDYEFVAETGQIQTDFIPSYDVKEGTQDGSLFALYRHQWLYCSVNTSYEYSSPRGTMKVLSGTSFTTSMTNIGSIPLLPHTGNYDDAKLAQLVTVFANRPVYNCQGTNCNWGYYGNYTMGRFLIQAGQVALIAEELGDEISRNKMVDWIKAELEDYFTYSGNDARYVGFNDTWDITLLHSDNIEHCSIDCLNDRNLQYGYWIRAAAIVEEFHPGWADQNGYGQIIDLLINDVSNTDRSSSEFPYMRNFDVYAGHSWALGFSDLSDGADQESSSESINFASALIYYGQVTGQQDLIERGMWMYTTEVIATEQYWFDVDEEVFPASFYPEMNGLVRSSGGFYQLWWQLLPEHVLMVNCFPWTGGALYLGRHPDANQRVYEWIETGAGQNGIQKWQGYLWPYKAFYDASGALSQYESTTYDYSVELESEANSYYWLKGMDDLGQIDASIWSDAQSAVVFDKGGERSYVVYNATSEVAQVKFSDNLIFDVPADTTIILKNGDEWQVTSTNDVVVPQSAIEFNSVEKVLSFRETGAVERFRISDLNGRILLQDHVEKNANVDLSLLPKGLYVVHAQSSYGADRLKILID